MFGNADTCISFYKEAQKRREVFLTGNGGIVTTEKGKTGIIIGDNL